MAIKVYLAPLGGPSRAVLIVAKAIGVELEQIVVDLMKGEHMTPEFLKMSPQHAVPVLDDNGFIVSESRAIVKYLIDAYAKDKSLYPEAIRTRTLINARLDFDAGTLLPAAARAYLLPLFRNTTATQFDFDAVKDALNVLNQLIGDDNVFLVGGKLSIADIAISATLNYLEVVDYDLSSYKNVVRFLENARKVVPGYAEINTKAIENFKGILGSLKKQ